MSVKRRDLIEYLEENGFYLLLEGSSPKMPPHIVDAGQMGYSGLERAEVREATRGMVRVREQRLV